MDLKSILNLSEARPSSRTASSRSQTINEEAGLGDEWIPVERPPIVPADAPQSGDDGSSRYIQGSLPPGYQHDTSFVGTSYRGSNTPRLDLMPLGIQGNPSTNAAIQSTSRLTAVPSSSTPVTPVTVGDGLTHGRLPWPGDPGVVQLWDDFHGQNNGTFGSTIANQGIGQLGWSILGSTSALGGNLGGIPPYLGQFAWGNVGVQNEAAWMVFNNTSGGTGSASYTPNAWALAENPGCVISYVFKVDGSLNSTLNFEMTKKSMYIGLTGPAAATTNIAGVPSSRPDVFIGIRFDTTPGIADAFMTLEVVANVTTNTPARNNTQGVTKVTDVTPDIGEWHRLDIYFNATGSVTLTLDGSTTNTLTTPVPVMTFTTSASSFSANEGIFEVNWGTAAGDPVNPWGAGSLVTISGFGGGSAVLNGEQELVAGSNNLIWFDFPGNFSDTDSVSFSGFPSLFPLFLFGDDNTALPTANTATFFADFWSFVWNPNLGPNAPGTPDPTLPRYFA